MSISDSPAFKTLQHQFDLFVLASALLFGVSVTFMSATMGIGRWGMGIGSLLASAIYIVWRARGLVAIGEGGTNTHLTPARTYYKGASAVFLVTLSIAVLFNWYHYQYRPPVFFVLVAIAWSTLLIDCWVVRDSRALAAISLIKICAISIYYRATRYYELSTIPGNDTQFHLDMALLIYELGSLPAVEAVSHPQYIASSLWHVSIAIVHHVLGVQITNLPFLGAAIPFVLITVLGMYGLSHAASGTMQLGLLGALFVSFADFFILRGTSAIYTSSYTIPFTIVALLTIYRYHDRRGLLILGLFITAILLTHQLSGFIALIVICSVLGAVGAHRRYFGSGSAMATRASGPLLLTVGVALVAWWLQTPHGSGVSFFEAMVIRFVGVLSGLITGAGGSEGYAESLAQHSELSNLLYTFGSDLLFTIALLGVLVISHRSNQSPRHLYLFVPTVAVFLLAYPATVIGLSDLLLPHRILAFLQLFFVILASVAVIHALRQTSRPGYYALVGVVTFVLVFSMITTPYINRNSPVYLEDREPRVDLYEGEAEAAVWALEHDNTGELYHDQHMYSRQFLTLSNIHGHDFDEISVESYPEETPEEGTFYIRAYFAKQEDIAPAGTFGSGGERVDGDDVTDRYRVGTKAYDGGSVVIYVRELD